MEITGWSWPSCTISCTRTGGHIETEDYGIVGRDIGENFPVLVMETNKKQMSFLLYSF